MNPLPDYLSNHDAPPSQANLPGKASSQGPPARRRVRDCWRGLFRWFQANTFAPHWLPQPLRHPLVGYLVALLIEFAAAVLIILLLQLFPTFAFRGILTDVGVVLIALGWGAGPSLLATFVGTFLIYYALLPPYFTWTLADPADVLGLLMYVVVGVSISLLAGRSVRARRLAEEQSRLLAQAQARSALEYRRLRTVLDVLPSAVIIAGPQGQMLEANSALRTLWGEHVPLANDMTQYALYPALWARTGKPLAPEEWTVARALASGEAILNDEIEIETLDGQRKVILNSAAPIRDETGAITGAVVNAQDISEVRRLEREVAERAQELEATFETMADGVFVYDTEGRIKHLNAPARAILGPDAAARLERPMAERAPYMHLSDEHEHPLPLERLPSWRILHGESLTGAQAVDIDIQTNGRTRMYNISGLPLRDASGAIAGAVVVARDVTERRQLEQEVADRAAALETTFEAITDGIGLLDTHGYLLKTNRSFRALFGVERCPGYIDLPAYQRMTMLDARDAQRQPLALEALPAVRLLRGETVEGIDLLIKSLDERELAVNVSGAPIRDAQGHVSGGVEVFRDVTERHHLEQHTREALDALVAIAEAMAQGPQPVDTAALAGEAPPPVAETVPPGAAKRLAELTRSVLECRCVSLAAIELETGLLRPLIVVGLPPEQEQAWWASWSPQKRLEERLDASMAAALRAGEPVLLDTRHTPEAYWHNLYQARSGLIVPLRMGEELIGILFLDYGEREQEFTSQEEMALIRAISRLGALLLELDRLLRRWTEARANELALRATKEQMDTFLGIVSHELKNPLTSIKLALQISQRRIRKLATSIEEDMSGLGIALAFFQDQLVRTEAQVERLDRLVNDLLDASRVRAGKLELRPKSVDLAALVRQVIEEQREAAPGRVINLQVPADLQAVVEADPMRIAQVVTNYLTNALKYSCEDCPVDVGMHVRQQEVCVWVRDQGPGLPPDEQERVWERFHRARGIEVLSGTGIGLGLGLYICRIIIERHQGQVGVESVPGKGSTFWFTLPLSAQPGTPERAN